MDYFLEIDHSIKQLIKNHQIKEAVNMIQEQLKTFVPEPYFSQWKKILVALTKELNAKQANDEFNKWYNNLTKDQLMNKLIINHQVDFNFLQLYWKKFSFDEEQAGFFSYLFNSKQISQQDKFLLFYLVVGKMNHPFTFYNEIINCHVTVGKDTAIKYQQYQKQLNDLFEQLIKKDVTIRQWCHQCLDLLIIYCFPIFPTTYLKISNEKLVNLIVNYVNDCETNQANKENVISKIMQYFH